MNDIIIIGGGAAGMTAALYALRSGKKVLLIEKNSFGGQIALSPRVENYPSIKEMKGAEFSDNLFNQIDDLGLKWELDNIQKVEKNDNTFTVIGEYATYSAKSVIIATGVEHRKINVEGEDDLIGHGLSYCATCDGAFYSGQDVAVIGDANTALQYILLLANYCNKVYVCTLFDKFFADPTLINRMKKKNNIEIIQNIALQSFTKDGSELAGLNFINTKSKNKVNISVKGAFIAIGQLPKNDFLANTIDLTKNGYIQADENMATSTEGVFACGDCIDKKIRQLTTAVSDGTIAAINAVAYIDKI